MGSDNNERLEFLGDAILGFIITERLFEIFPGEPEGVLTRLRANMVRKDTLAILARDIELGSAIKLGPGEKKSGGWRRDSILANTMESIIGAIYLDSDIDHCRKFVLNLYRKLLLDLDAGDIGKDPKTILQELLQAKGLPLPVYEVIHQRGAAHDRTFTVSCDVSGVEHQVIAEGRSKRAAEQSAAEAILKLFAGPSK